MEVRSDTLLYNPDQNSKDPAGADELESCRDLYHQPHPAAERQKGPNLCDGTGRGDEGGSGAGGKICGIRADVKN